MSAMSQHSALAQKFSLILPVFDERQRRLYLAAEAQARGRGGIALVATAAGVSRELVRRGMAELRGEEAPQRSARSRRPGGGRKRSEVVDPGLVEDLERLVSPDTRGDPESPLRWTCKSTRQLAATLCQMGHQVTDKVVARLLREQGYSLQANAKTKEGKQHPDRDAQFGYLNEQVKAHLAAGAPVLSVDTKKKELVGEFRNGGREWLPKGEPEKVRVHDFIDPELGRAIPYGIYDVGRNTGWVNVGSDHDTASFAVETLRRWWQGEGRDAYADADRLLICADGGGSNGSQLRLWKTELAALATEIGMEITVCHLPPGTSKWNKIEHRLFSHISMNWRGRPLTSYKVVVELIGATTTRQGLRVHAELDRDRYPTSVKVPDHELAAVPLTKHDFHGEWNYSVAPARTSVLP